MKNKENTLGANKQMAFLNTTKLAVLSAMLLLAVFCTIGMSFTPAEEGENVGNPNDSTYITGPRRSSSYSCSGLSISYKNATDYGRVEVKIMVWDENGKAINIDHNTVGSVILTGKTAPYSATNGNTYQASITSPNPTSGTDVFINWNSDPRWTSQWSSTNMTNEIIEACHTLNVTMEAITNGTEYEFYGWTKHIMKNDKTTYYRALPSTKPTEEDGLITDGAKYTNKIILGDVDDDGKEDGFTNTHNNHKTTWEHSDSPHKVIYYAHFAPPKPQEIKLKATKNGSYTFSDGAQSGTISSADGSITTSKQITLTAIPASDDYKFFGWYEKNGNQEKYLSYSASWTKKFTVPTTIYAKFIPKDAALFIIKRVDGEEVDGTEYWNLNEACEKAKSSSSKVVLPKADGTLYPLVDGELCTSIPENKIVENYTIPSDDNGAVTLLVPYNGDHETQTKAQTESSQSANPTCYRTLTIASDVKVIVNSKAKVDVGGVLNTGGQTNTAIGAPRAHGKIRMANGSSITLEDESHLYCWGYIVGAEDNSEGTILAKKGSTVHEGLQIRDWKGGKASLPMQDNKKRVFPIHQYYLQNIETPITFEYGSEDLITTGMRVSVLGSEVEGRTDDQTFISSTGGLFNFNSSDATLVRDYDEKNDRIIYNISGSSFSFDQLNLNLKAIGMGVDIVSENYVLPITNNMTLHIKARAIELGAELFIAPGAELYIEEGSNVICNKNVYVLDKDDWVPYQGVNIFPLQYANETNYKSKPIRTWEDIQDAKICVNGTVQINQNLYTSKGKANICSTGKGVIVYKGSSPQANSTMYMVANATNNGAVQDSDYKEVPVTPAQLHNDESKNPNYHYTQTSGAAAGDEFWYVKSLGKWVKNEPLDIVDADNTNNKTLTINANGWVSSGWPYTINDTKYGKNNQSETEKYRQPDRTLVITYSGEPNADMPIVVKNASNEIVSSHIYKVPFVYTGTENMNAMNENSIVFVKSGTTLQTTDGAKAKEIYVAPGAELKVNGTLTVGKLVLRTTPWQSAVLTNNGTINGQVYYSRIAPNKSTIKDLQNTEIEYNSARYYQFGLPLSCSISSVTMSNTGKFGESNTPYGNTWLLKSYNESKRAENGISSSGDNWEALESTGTITAGVGYEMFSNSNYYREFYFPVTLPATATTTVGVSYTGGTKAEHNGWNIITSPLTSRANVPIIDPATAFKVCWLQADGSYRQELPTVIPPAIPFSIQTSAKGKLNFAISTTAAAPRKQSAAEALTETEWVHLDIYDTYGEGDETSLFVHPTRFEQTYKTGIDVAKQSLTAARPIIYSTHAYGDMAFAGIADSLLENGIDLAVYSPAAQELTFSLRENKFLSRLEYLWLADNETGARTDLLMDDYTCRANAGTTKGRFVLNGRFKAPQISTGIGNIQTDYNIYAIGNNIAISGVEQGTPIYIFDAVGHMIYTTAATSDEVIVPAPCAGVYMLTIGGQTAKLVINKY